MENDANEYKKNIEKLNETVSKGNNTISSLRKDIDGKDKEIKERDETIQDKVRHFLKLCDRFFFKFSYSFIFIGKENLRL